MRLSCYASRLTSVFALCMIWLQRFTTPLVVAMNKGCHYLSTVLTKSRESKGFLKFVLGNIAEYCQITLKCCEKVFKWDKGKEKKMIKRLYMHSFENQLWSLESEISLMWKFEMATIKWYMTLTNGEPCWQQLFCYGLMTKKESKKKKQDRRYSDPKARNG